MSDGIKTYFYNQSELLTRIDPDNRIAVYFDLLSQENKRINLVSRETIAGHLPKLTAESLEPLEILEQSHIHRYLDIGSGGGFPAVPILLTRNIENVTLVERTLKKVAALRRILLALNLKAGIAPVTFEEFKPLDNDYDLITMRLVKLTSRLLNRIIPLLSSKGVFVYYAQAKLDKINDATIIKSARFQDEQGETKMVTYFYRNE
ncbi:MAG: hypothetical protein DRP47_00870 [Candidatus Zixiibacteriota bacterium]|nr:MAG: hypothetical protein DRP47_00870 [candidate division Zixibacteria bacterium]